MDENFFRKVLKRVVANTSASACRQESYSCYKRYDSRYNRERCSVWDVVCFSHVSSSYRYLKDMSCYDWSSV